MDDRIRRTLRATSRRRKLRDWRRNRRPGRRWAAQPPRAAHPSEHPSEQVPTC